MNYLGMNKKEFLAYTIKMVAICIKIQIEEKKMLEKYGLDGVYDQ